MTDLESVSVSNINDGESWFSPVKAFFQVVNARFRLKGCWDGKNAKRITHDWF
jgi:hypothetical protein